MDVFLPGLEEQFRFTKKAISDFTNQKILVIGADSEEIAVKFSELSDFPVELIVDDYDAFIKSKLSLTENENVSLKVMEYEATDFDREEFDLIYAQASVGSTARNKIVKEIKRILKPGGLFCSGEIVSLTESVPRVIEDIFQSAEILPLFVNDIEKYYSQRGWRIIERWDFSTTLRRYYSLVGRELNERIKNLSDREKSYYKKIINRTSHETHIYLKSGGDKHIGFTSLILRKEQNEKG